ncbi:MAG: phage holin family protein [Desulfobacteraceae bacterium]|nr:phage holin family protein [Desulfobacteraceae bacterium]
MRGIFFRWSVLTAAVFLTAYMFDGIRINSFMSALLAAAILGILNAFFRPIAIILTLPINLLTLGLFTFLVNAAILKMVSGLISGFEVQGFWTSVFGALFISIVSWLINSLIGDRGRWEYIQFKHKRK